MGSEQLRAAAFPTDAHALPDTSLYQPVKPGVAEADEVGVAAAGARKAPKSGKGIAATNSVHERERGHGQGHGR
ncbi:hypothetical protein ACF090_35090 [Streptomyces sp. NPDC014892]|uniref:hypothetical protein n=1 Tax=Streptomyces TaxID=1883 RepID=UPI001EFA452D|nr:hypothetical protein [Streptomyces deccanensis]ULR54773.1 hypothetical protein L3078_38880 [Streptomyces deccanensis]